MRNRDVANLLDNIADILELKGEGIFRVRAYREAARHIESLTQDIAHLMEKGDLRKIPGIGESIAAKIEEYLTTGKLEYYENLKRETPAGMVIMLQVPGLGSKRIQALYKNLGIKNLTELQDAASEHRLHGVPGMGEKTEQNILRELERLQRRSRRYLLGVALPAAEEVAALLRQTPVIERAIPAGSIRRMKETIGDIDILVSTNDPEAAMDAFVKLPMVRDVIARGPTKCSILTYADLQIDIRVVSPDYYGSALQYFTGSKEHNIKLRDIAIKRGLKISEYGIFEEPSNRLLASKEEEDIYRVLDIPIMPPEIRENRGEIEAALARKLPDLIELADIKGDLHVHTKYSDGTDTLEAMAEAARSRGYKYMAICDHSKSLGVAGGLSEERVAEVRGKIQELNAKMAPFRILHGTEVDIRADGSIDYDDEVLATFDIVTASIHSGFGQSREKITHRIVSAMRNPYVDVINHPSGRLIGKRDPYEVDLEEVIRVAAETGTALEINSQPDRLDLDDVSARRAKEKGIKLTINSDSHSTSQLDFVRYGVATARRGWVEKNDVLNAMSLDELLAWLSQHRARSKSRLVAV